MTITPYGFVAVPVKEATVHCSSALRKRWSRLRRPQQFVYDVSPDGKKILLDVVSQQVSQSVTVVTNFTAGVKK